jgi:hypothetical protein
LDSEVRILKILVDKMPNEPKECIFSKCTNQLHGNYACNLYQGRGCEPNKCVFLKPISDYHMVEHMSDNVVKMIPIK